MYFIAKPDKVTKSIPEQNEAINLFVGFIFLNKSSNRPKKNIGREDKIIRSSTSLVSLIKKIDIKKEIKIATPPNLGVGRE